jgi:hypothetical protein
MSGRPAETASSPICPLMVPSCPAAETRYPFPMPTAFDPEGSAGDASPKLTLWQRLDRLRYAAINPNHPKAAESKGAYELSGEELVREERRANDKERAIGLLVGPVATIISFLVVHDLVAHDPSAYLSDGAVNHQHVNPSTYSEVLLVLLILSFGITGMALWRKRLFLGIVTALYGLTIFNLHYWGFGAPFIMVGAWYLVRAYRLHRNLSQSTSDRPSAKARPPSKSGRYTPPSPRRPRSAD